MVQRLGSERKNHVLATTRGAIWCIAVVGAWLAGTAACATGVDVSQAELAEICSEPNIDCLAMGMAAGSGGSSGTGQIGGVSGSSGSGTSGSFGTGGTVSSTGGTTGASGSTGTSGSSGTSGSAGSSGTVLKPLAKGMCMSASSVVIDYTDRSDGKVNQASMTLHVQNNGPAFDLTDLTMRYWFTDDGLGPFTLEVDYAQLSGGQQIQKSDVTSMFGTESGSNYVQIGFTAAGNVAMGGVVDQVQVRFHTNDYKDMDTSNDFSFHGGASGTANANITPYVNGMQVGGCVPIPQ